MYCLKCGKELKDGTNFCDNCGTKTKKLYKRMVIVIIAVIIAAISVTTIIIVEQTKQKKQRQKELDYIVQEYQNKPTKYDIEIVPGWTFTKKGNYTYIEGFVKNTSSKNINYYEIAAKYLDSNDNVIDTDWTNGIHLDPGDSQSFEIMHKYYSECKYVRLEIREVS